MRCSHPISIIVEGNVMMNRKYFSVGGLALVGMFCAAIAGAQTVNVSEDCNGTSTPNSWYYFNGACLTASTSGASGSPGTPPGCTSIASSYYNEHLVGGYGGVARSPQTLPDSSGNGGPRFTHGRIYSSGCTSRGPRQNAPPHSGLPTTTYPRSP